jgi:hypothetical protein
VTGERNCQHDMIAKLLIMDGKVVKVLRIIEFDNSYVFLEFKVADMPFISCSCKPRVMLQSDEQERSW